MSEESQLEEEEQISRLGTESIDQALGTSTDPQEVSISQRFLVLGYRCTLFSVALGFSVSFAATTLLQGTGLGLDTLEWLQEASHAVLLWSTYLTGLLAPPLSNHPAAADSEQSDSISVLLPLLTQALRTLGVVAILIHLIGVQDTLPFEYSSLETLEIAAILSGICVREILFYGIAYKVEAVVALVFLLLQASNQLPEAVTVGGLSLALLVLSVGKVFEPISSDLVPDQSAFFLKR